MRYQHRDADGTVTVETVERTGQSATYTRTVNGAQVEQRPATPAELVLLAADEAAGLDDIRRARMRQAKQALDALKDLQPLAGTGAQVAKVNEAVVALKALGPVVADLCRETVG